MRSSIHQSEALGCSSDTELCANTLRTHCFIRSGRASIRLVRVYLANANGTLDGFAKSTLGESNPAGQ